jgi:hypothetical protein
MILTRTARHFQVSLDGVADLLPQAFRFGPAKPPSVKKTPSRRYQPARRRLPPPRPLRTPPDILRLARPARGCRAGATQTPRHPAGACALPNCEGGRLAGVELPAPPLACVPAPPVRTFTGRGIGRQAPPGASARTLLQPAFAGPFASACHSSVLSWPVRRSRRSWLLLRRRRDAQSGCDKSRVKTQERKKVKRIFNQRLSQAEAGPRSSGPSEPHPGNANSALAGSCSSSFLESSRKTVLVLRSGHLCQQTRKGRSPRHPNRQPDTLNGAAQYPQRSMYIYPT